MSRFPRYLRRQRRKPPPEQRVTEEQLAKAFHVPYWVITADPYTRKPSWVRRPIWRLRALRWSRQ